MDRPHKQSDWFLLGVACTVGDFERAKEILARIQKKQAEQRERGAR